MEILAFYLWNFLYELAAFLRYTLRSIILIPIQIQYEPDLVYFQAF